MLLLIFNHLGQKEWLFKSVFAYASENQHYSLVPLLFVVIALLPACAALDKDPTRAQPR